MFQYANSFFLHIDGVVLISNITHILITFLFGLIVKERKSIKSYGVNLFLFISYLSFFEFKRFRISLLFWPIAGLNGSVISSVL